MTVNALGESARSNEASGRTVWTKVCKINFMLLFIVMIFAVGLFASVQGYR